MRAPSRLVVAQPTPFGVRYYDGNAARSVDFSVDWTDTLVLTNDVKNTVRHTAERPLMDWRYWHHRFRLVRAHKRGKCVIRDWLALGEWFPADISDLREVWENVATVREWCELQGIEFKPSASAIGIELLNKNFTPNFPPLFSMLSDEDLIKPGFYGGRCQPFTRHLDKSGRFNGPAFYYDANGAYLDIMRTVEMPYPYRFVPYACIPREGITEVTITENTSFPVLPSREHGYHNGKKRGHWTNAEIRRAIDYGARLHAIHGGLHYVRTVKVLQPLGGFLANEREKRNGQRGFLKRIPNALIGRFATSPSLCVNRESDGSMRAFKNDPRVLSALSVGEGVYSVEMILRRRSPWYATAWAAAITAEQRLRLHEKMNELERHGYKVLYCDTDGMIVAPGNNPLPRTSHTIGEYKIEWVADSVFIQGSKAYVANRRDAERVVIKAGTPRGKPLAEKFPGVHFLQVGSPTDTGRDDPGEAETET